MWKLLSGLFRKAGAKVLLVAVAVSLAVVGLALWLSAVRAWELEQGRLREIGQLREEVARLGPLVAEARERAASYAAEIEAQQRRLETARRLAESTAELLTWWKRLWMSEEDIRNLERREQLAARSREEAEGLLARARQAQGEAYAELARLADAETGSSERLALLERSADPFMNALRESWGRLRPWVYGAVFALLFGPFLWKLFCYYLWAPWVQRESMAGEAPAGGDPSVLHSGPSVPVLLAPGERLLVRPACAQSSGEGLARGHRWLLDWRHPFSSIAAGLYGLYGYSAGERGATVNIVPPPGAGESDCVEVQVPEGTSVAARPGVLVGLVPPAGLASPAVRSRWLFNRRAAWLALRFRMLEYSGPCRLVVHGARGLRGIPTDGFGRRVRPGATVARTSGLPWGIVRAETFWGYAWAGEPLFDHLYRGRGWVLVQDGGPAEEGTGSSWWKGLGDGLLRIFGI